ncbi:hypothetical protein SAMN02787142_0684 [Burkholderia sp. WP9]|nr:hypothetical protein SAMN02787142_0684 [Burkholderia sp. WP9]
MLGIVLFNGQWKFGDEVFVSSWSPVADRRWPVSPLPRLGPALKTKTGARCSPSTSHPGPPFFLQRLEQAVFP